MGRKKQKQEEFIDEVDFSSEDCEVYRPTAVPEEDLEVDEEAYTVLEYIDLEWPAMSLDTRDSTVVLGTYPENQDNGSQLVEVNLSGLIASEGTGSPAFKKHGVKRIFSKIRIHNAIFGLSNGFLTKFDFKYKVISEVKGSYRFGLAVTPEYVIAGCNDGTVEVYAHDLKLVRRITAGEAPIECVGFDPTVKFTRDDGTEAAGVVVAGSLDHSVRVFDLNGTLIKTISCDAEVNSLDVRGGHLVFGDDSGLVHLVDLNTGSRETLQWHCTPISFVRWKDDDVFLSGSDEQVCVWDRSLEKVEDSKGLDKTESSKGLDKSESSKGLDKTGNLNIPNNLIFVHQGQRYYKDCAFYGDVVVVTSEGGLCLFEPISLMDYED